jgi:ribose 5-phosphate isomerase B
MGLRVALGADHRGFALKQALAEELSNRGMQVDDTGAFSDEPADYPDFARLVAEGVSRGTCDRGILICGSGIGMSIAANKFPGVRAALCHDRQAATMCRKHNDANVLVLAETAGVERAREMLAVWLATPFEGGRHQKRLDGIRQIEHDNFKKTP